MAEQPFRLDGFNNWLGQGDLFRDLDLSGTAGELLDLVPNGVLVLDHECQIDKPRTSGVICVGTALITDLHQGVAGHVRSGRIHHTMFLPGIIDQAEQYADLRFQFRLPKQRLEDAMAQGRRVASMTEEGRLALQESIFRYYARRLHEE